ncbi:PadR family transcriptional regulator [Dactylosporangium sp. CA-233914]|uniref:PadR family transcriptional regulator n=1 Tax=Dactylosporangium sp. CA-233914 TaxID=3239934 RepID=UPI003D8F0EFC
MLLALADGPRHGYAIMQTVVVESGGDVRLGPTTLYRTLRTLHEAGLVCEVPHDDPADDARRRYYDITAAGRAAAREQVRRLQQLVDTARTKPLFDPGPA